MNKMTKSLLVLLLGVSACAPPMNVVATPPTYETISTPKIGETGTAEVGDSIITMTHAVFTPAIRFHEMCSFSEQHDAPGTGIVHFKVNRGAIFKRESITNGVPAYCGETTQFGAVAMRHCVATDGSKIVPFPNSEMLVQSDCAVDLQTVAATSPESLKKELLYDGKSGSTVHFSYREFYQDMARPAFTQELSYDIGDDHVIGFKSARFEIIEAKNTSIKYKVLSGF